MAVKPKTYTGDDVVALRKKLNLNQSEFWSPLGVTQSGGSRYESGRKIPRPVQKLLAIAYGTEKQAEAVLNALTTTVLDTVRAGNELAITDLGKFGSAQRAAKTGRNPKTGETIQIAAKRAPKFSPAKALKDAAAA